MLTSMAFLRSNSLSEAEVFAQVRLLGSAWNVWLGDGEKKQNRNEKEAALIHLGMVSSHHPLRVSDGIGPRDHDNLRKGTILGAASGTKWAEYNNKPGKKVIDCSLWHQP